MFTTEIINTDSFMLFEILDDKGVIVDSVSITKYYPYNILHFFPSEEEYLECSSQKIKDLTEKYIDRLDFDEAIEKRSEAEFILYTTVKGID